MAERLLKVRSEVKKRKPTYRRQQNNQFAKFKKSSSWRRPKGHQSKMRLNRKGHRGMPTVGYGSPKAVKGLNRDGLREVIVNNVSDLAKVNGKEEIAVIGRTVGGRKRLDILNEAKKLKLSIANVKDIDKTIDALTKKKKQVKAEKPQKKEEVKESKKEVSETKTETKAETSKGKKEEVAEK